MPAKKIIQDIVPALKNKVKYIFLDLIVILPLLLIFSPPKLEAQTTVPTDKKIMIDLSKQHLYAYQRDQVIYDFLISSGKWAPTPTGTFNVYWKTPSTRMQGGSKALGTYYDLPNVPNNMFFYKGYAIHGAYWHNNFGAPMSHGCVNMKIADSKLLYDWTDYNTPIHIY